MSNISQVLSYDLDLEAETPPVLSFFPWIHSVQFAIDMLHP